MGAGGGVGRQSHEADAACQVGGVDAWPGRERIVAAYGEHPRQIDDGALLDAAHRAAHRDPGQVEVAGQQGVEAAAAGGLGLELQAHLRVAAPEGDDRLGHEVPDRRSAGRDAHGTAFAVHEVSQAAQRTIETGDPLGGGIAQDAPRRRGNDPARLALQQAQARLPLQALDVLAHRGLCTGQVTGHGTEASRPAHGHEHTQVIERHNTQATPGICEAIPRIDWGTEVPEDRCRAQAATRTGPSHGSGPAKAACGCRPTLSPKGTGHRAQSSCSRRTGCHHAA